MEYHLRHTCCTRGEVDEHIVVSPVGDTLELVGSLVDKLTVVEIEGVVGDIVSAYEDLFKSRALGSCRLYVVEELLIVNNADSLSACGFTAVYDVLCGELEGSGDNYSSELVESDEGEPYLRALLEPRRGR